MDSVAASDVQQAYDRAVEGDIETLVGLLASEVDWTGLQRGHFWWRKAPA